jgi:hypothetical protein
MKEFMSASYIEKGFKARLFSFHRFNLTAMTVDGLRFINNVAYNYTGFENQKSIQPVLISFNESDFISDVPDLSVRNIEISENIFYNSEYMASLYKLNMVYEDFIINNNGRQVDIDTNQAILKI